MQKTDFPLEIVVGEDCSTDGTREIVQHYADRFPTLLRVMFAETNKGGMENVLQINAACRGKYLALCEGDDYWIDPLKLQKQVEFLEAHPECPMCFHDALVVHEGKGGLPRYYCPKDLPQRVTLEDVLTRTFFIPTASVVVRKGVIDSLPAWRRKVSSGDLLCGMWCAHHGPLGYLDEIMSVYRKHDRGLSRAMGADMEKTFAMWEFLYREYDKDTGYAHTILIHKVLKAMYGERREYRLRKRFGLGYFLVRPDRLFHKLRCYRRLIDLQRAS